MTDQQRERIKTLSMASRRASHRWGVVEGLLQFKPSLAEDRGASFEQAAEDAYAALMSAIAELDVPDAR